MRHLGMKPEDEYKLSVMREHISKLAQARHGFASRLSDDSFPQPSDIGFPGGIGFQELGIVPQTIILRVRTADEIASGVRDPSRGGQQSDAYPRRFSTEAPRSPGSVAGSNRHVSGGQPIEDLRRRLAMAGGASSTSVNSQQADSSFLSTSLVVKKTSDALGLERTLSYNSSTDDLSDTAGSVRTETVPSKARSRVHLGAVEVGRVAPAVGQDSTNVMGLFNLASRYRLDDDAMSGTNTPSAAAPFAKSGVAENPATQRFVSTYGTRALPIYFGESGADGCVWL